MTPDELDAYLRVARAHGVLRLKVGDVEVALGPPPPPTFYLPAGPGPESLPLTRDDFLDKVERDLFQTQERFG